MDRSKEETIAYEKAVKHLVVGDSEQYRLAAPSRSVDGGLTKSPFTITEMAKFDSENNELAFETEGVQGGIYSLFVRFDEKKVYHAHDVPSDPTAKSAIYDIQIED
jgi:hypothetical protein